MNPGSDWSHEQNEACPECGADPSMVDDDELGPWLLREVAAWGHMLAAADPWALGERPEAGGWSALEYAGHVRDLLAVATRRIRQMREEDDPVLESWDHEAAAIDERYNEQVPVLMVEGLAANAREFAALLASVAAGNTDEWDRGGIRASGGRVTIRGQGRFVLHEVIHHREDAERLLRRSSTSTS